MTTTMVKATDIVKVLGEGAGRVEALKSIDLSLAGGELTLLIGPSGSGKTTLLSVLGCMLSPTTGTMEIRGRSTTGLDAEELARLRRDNVGFVFQSYHLFPTLTAAENVRLALDVRGDRSPSSRVKAEKALATVGLSHKANAFPRELSGGEQQRVAIARAIVGDASVPSVYTVAASAGVPEAIELGPPQLMSIASGRNKSNEPTFLIFSMAVPSSR